jgi:nucleosome assembly protein 1-like 1
LKNSTQFGHVINKNDEKVLQHLKDLTVDFKESGCFNINFYFTPNTYFDHEVLTREFVLDTEKQSVSKINSTKIEWKGDDNNPTIEKKKKKIKNKKKNETKTVTKYEEVESFFNFFKEYDIANVDKKKEDDADEDEEDEVPEDEIIEEEYDLGLFIKEELIPYAIEYYLGVIKDEDDGCDEEDFEDDEDALS